MGRKLKLQRMEGNTIENVDSVSFLGATIDSHLSWGPHISKLCIKLGKSCFAIKQLIGLLKQEDIKEAYFALVESHVRYAITCWGHASSAVGVLRAQKKVVRIMAKKPARHPAKQIFKDLKILTQPALYILQLTTNTHVHASETTVRSDIHEHSTRNAGMMDEPRVRLRATQHSPSVAGIRLYNQLPSHLKQLPPKNFKTELKKLLLEAAPYSVDEFFTGAQD